MSVTEKQIFEIIETTFRHREAKIIEAATRHAMREVAREIQERQMVLRLRQPRPVKADYRLANESLRRSAA